MARIAVVNRKTAETDIVLQLNLDGIAIGKISTGSAFFNHMMNLFSSHSHFGLDITAHGDTDVDFHHSCEDIGICLGRAFSDALGDRAGIARYGWIILPMDEALILASVDISGRGHLNYDVDIKADKVGDFDTELVEEFLLALTREMGISLHIKQLAGTNSHHIIEGIFKALGHILADAVAIDERQKGAIPSTKGTIL